MFESFSAEGGDVVLDVLAHVAFKTAEITCEVSIVKLSASEVNPEFNLLFSLFRVNEVSASNQDGVVLELAVWKEWLLELCADSIGVLGTNLAQGRIKVRLTLELIEYFNVVVNANSSVLAELLHVTGKLSSETNAFAFFVLFFIEHDCRDKRGGASPFITILIVGFERFLDL